MTIEDIDRINAEYRENNQKETKILIELEIKKEDGYNSILNCMFREKQ